MIRLAVLLLLSFSLYANDCADGIDNDGDGLTDTDDIDCRTEGEIARIEYSFEQQSIDGIDRPVRVRGIGYAPPGDDPAPLVLINTMNHSRCISDAGEFLMTSEYECPNGYSEVPLAEGMLYIAERLAKLGAIAIAIDSNQLVWWSRGEYSSDEVLAQRVALLREHIRYWRDSVTSVSLVGHSMGGKVAVGVAAIEDIESVALIAPAVGLNDDPDVRFAVVLGACDEDPGTHHLPGLHMVDRAIDRRDFDILQAYLPAANHAQFNEAAKSTYSGCITEPMPGAFQRQETADVVAHFLLGERYSGGSARLSEFAPVAVPVEPEFSGFDEVFSCSGQDCEPFDVENQSPRYYHQHLRPAYRLTWSQPAEIEVRTNGTGALTFRVTQTIVGNEPGMLRLSVHSDGVLTALHFVPFPVTAYKEPCSEYFGDIWCFSWWSSVPRQVFQTIRVPPAEVIKIGVSGSGRMVVADFEVSQ